MDLGNITTPSILSIDVHQNHEAYPAYLTRQRNRRLGYVILLGTIIGYFAKTIIES